MKGKKINILNFINFAFKRTVEEKKIAGHRQQEDFY